MLARLLTVAFAAIVLAAGAGAQESTQPPADAPRLFLDCNEGCDANFFRTELTWVNWVRDRSDAQIHLLITSQSTGGGGREYVLHFIGLREFAARTDTVRYISTNSDSDDTTRKGLLNAMQAGLVPFAMSTSIGPRLRVTLAEASAEQKAAASNEISDPWNYWVFSLRVGGNLNGESSQNFQSYNTDISAKRTTAAWKMGASLSGNYSQSKFTYPVDETRDTTVRSIRKRYEAEILVVKSVGPHWSVGIESEAESATFGNISLGLSGGPAIEWSYWPYDEATRRSLVFRYSPQVRTFDYREITIFDRTEETHPAHRFSSELELTQPWGSSYISADFSQYLHDRGKYSASSFANVNVRLFKGFSIDFYGEYAWVRDQLSLSREGATPDEVLLQQKELETNYRFWGGFGVRYSFGSIYNNVVNPRF